MAENKNSILITGGTKGIGLGIARLFASRGYHSFLNYASDHEAASEAKNSILKSGFSSSTVCGNVKSEPDVVSIYEQINRSGYALQTIVVNAVDEIPKPIDEVTLDEWHHVLLTKLDGAFLIIKHGIELLKYSKNPNIIVITSVDGWRPNGQYIAYQVGTAGLIAMSIGCAQYLGKKYGIRVNSIAPGPVKTDLWRKAGQTPEMWAEFESSNPLGRVAEPLDVAEAAWYLAQDTQRFINGTTIHVDGGSQWQ